MSWLKKRHRLNVGVQKWRLVFTKCTICESLKDLISKLGKHSNNAREYEVKLRKHILHQKSCRNLYHTWRIESIWSKEEFLCVIHDKMDQTKIAFPRPQLCNKMIFRLGQFLVISIDMIAHQHREEIYAQYLNKLWPNDPNFTIGPLL
jgi:hypothetical protein